MRNRDNHWMAALLPGPGDASRADRAEEESIRRFARLRQLCREVEMAARTAEGHLRLDLALRLERESPAGEREGRGR